MPKRDYYLPERSLVSQADASITEPPRVPRARFTGSWNYISAFNAGYLIPFMVEEVLPGDHLRYRFTPYVRMSTPLFPLFSNQRVDIHVFFVPNRILWPNWPRFMGEQPEGPSQSIEVVHPYIDGTIGGEAVGSIYDYMGIPTVGQVGGGVSLRFSALPLRAYNHIYNQWFRDQNAITALPIYTADGSGTGDPVGNYSIQRRAKSHDYFTSALPWTQKFTATNIPLGGSAAVLGIGFVDGSPDSVGPSAFRETGGASGTYDRWNQAWVASNVVIKATNSAADAYPSVYADLSTATGVTINNLRQAFLVQQMLERDARGGTRYTEILRSHFGVISPDARLQRPEYIGGGQSPLNITPIAQTAPTAGVPLGALGGAGTSAGQASASYAATEHGIIIGLISVKSELAYQQGLHRKWWRFTRYDYPWPSLAQLGEQAVLNKEIYCTGLSGDASVFGYQERYQEYRTNVSVVTGIMRSTAASSIHQWHLAQQFSSTPTLGATFLNDTPPMDRVLAAGAAAGTGFQQYLCDILIHRDAVRPLPTYGTPATLGRF